MAGVGGPNGGVSAGALHGARTAYEIHAPQSHENSTTPKNSSRSGSLRQSSGGSSRMPLSSVAPNRKGTNEHPSNGRAAHSRIEELGQQDGGISRSGSEPDSLLDLYKNNASNGNISTDSMDNDIPENMYKPEDNHPEGWIHRDKLAKIESEELQAAGINLANARKTQGRLTKRETSRSRRMDESGSVDYSRPGRDDKKPRLSEPAVEEEDEKANWDFRTPEEIAADSAASQLYSNPVLRKSGSKIPILTSSPVPIPAERLERDTPIPRKRTMSNSMSPEDGSWKDRSRKNSTGSQMLLDDAEAEVSTPVQARATSKPSSPTKGKKIPTTTASPPAAAAAGRKVTPGSRKPSISTTTTTTKPAQPSSPTSPRPGTRSGEVDRPKTAVNGPEGDPPWLATMYKPDPMLPPDQQIIPTHARRQQQAQWTDAGAVPITYDREFSPLAVHTSEGLVKQSSPPTTSPSSDKPPEGNAWPLKSMPSVRSNNSARPGTSGSITGGYSTMPRMKTPPAVQSPRLGGISTIRTSNPPTQVPARMQDQRPKDEMDDGTVKKGCGCCIVM